VSGLGSRTFGVGLWSGQRPWQPGGRHFAEAVPLVKAAEVAGFDAFWVPEHHGWDGGYLPSPLPLLAALAAVTSTIRLGTGVIVAPLHDPLRLAEDAVVVDHLSGGRLILGLGLGYAPAEYRMFGVDEATRGRRLDETVEVLRRAWTGEPFSWSGKVFSFSDVRVTPRPLGKIPIWLGGYSVPAVRRAARLADGHLVGRGAPQIIDAAVAALRADVDPADPAFTLGVNVTAVLDGPRGHADEARRAFAVEQAAYEALQRQRSPYTGVIAEPGRWTSGRPARPIDEYLQVTGGPDRVVDGLGSILEGLEEWVSVHIALRILFPEPDVDAQLERLAAFGSEVLPHLRSHPHARQ